MGPGPVPSLLWPPFLMHHTIKLALLGSMLSVVISAAEPVPGRPWESRDLTAEAGLLWNIGVRR